MGAATQDTGTAHAPPAWRAAGGWSWKALDRFVVALLLLGLYYNAYRYPLQINASGTSPTYSDTPPWLSLGKYVLVAFLLLLIVLLRLGRREPITLHRPLFAVAFLFLALVPIVSGILVGELEFVTTGFFFLVPFVLQLLSGARLDFRAVNRVLRWSVYLAVLVNAVQVALFLTTGRLPALGHEGSLSVRFGSFLDDPNGFGLLLCWLLPFAVAHLSGARRWFVVGGLFVSVLLTQSMTAVGAFIIVAVVLGLLSIADRPRLLFPALVAVLLGVVALGSLVYTYWREIELAYSLFMATKEGSLAQHGNALTMFRDLELLNLAGIQPLSDRWTETGYVNLLAYYGILYVAVYLYVGASAWLGYLAAARDPGSSDELRSFAWGAMGLLIAVYAGNLVLPVVSIFPIDLFAALLLGIAAAGMLREMPGDRGSGASAPPRAVLEGTAAR